MRYVAAGTTSCSSLSTGQGPTAALSAYQYALTADPFLKHTTPCLFASDSKTWKAPPPSSGIQVIRAYQSTIPLTNWRKQLPPTRSAAATTHLICHFESPHPTHRQHFPVQQAPNSFGVRTLLLEGKLYRHLQQERCRSPKPPTIRTRTAYAHLLDPAADPMCPLCKEEPQAPKPLPAEMANSRCPLATHLW